MAVGIDNIKPGGKGWPITPSDSTIFVEKTRGIIVGGAGNLVVLQMNPQTGKEEAVTHAVQAGLWAIETSKVFAATTATGLSALA